MSETATLVAIPHALDASRAAFAEVQAGQTIAQMLGDGVARTCAVTVGGHPVPRELWARVRPKAGTIVHATIYPAGGTAGKVIKIAALVVLTYFTAGYGASMAGAFGITSTGGVAAFSAGMMVAGSMLINALIPPPTPKGLGGGGDPFQQLNSITGTQNNANPGGIIPCVVGQVRFFPTHAAMPYTEVVGNNQYLRMLLDLGYGDLDISDIRIGETDIATYTDVEWEISKTPTLFTQDVYELAVGVALNADNDTAQRTTQGATTEISLDLLFPQGLFSVDKNGNTLTVTMQLAVQYRPVGSSTWTMVSDSTSGLNFTGGMGYSTGLRVTGGGKKMVRCGVRWAVPAGQYEVAVTRGATAYGASAIAGSWVGDAQWTVLRSISPQNPSTTGTTKLAVRIKATDQLNGVVSTLSVLATQKIRRYDPATQTWLAPVASTNPAWIYHWLLTDCPAVVRRLPDDRLDTIGIANWAGECDTKGFAIGFAMSQGRALIDWLKDIAAAGRASFGLRNGQYSVVRDLPQVVPVQMFTPANSSDFSFARVFSDPPQALRVTFTNTQANYQNDVVTVYADGYSAANATRFETLDAGMVIDPNAAWRLGRYHLAVARGRPNTYAWKADIENLVCERGDLVHVAHDIIGYGLAWGRISAISGTSVTLDGPFTPEAGKSYVIQGRSSSMGKASAGITATADPRVFALAASLDGIEAGDLYVLGEANLVTTPLIVQMVEPSDDLTATITGVDAAPEVLLADAGTPPDFVSAITGTAWCAAPPPPVVHIRAGDSSPDDAGVVHAQTGVGSAPQGGIFRFGSTGGGCVVVESILGDMQRAGDVAVGDTLDMADPVTLAPRSAAVTYSAPELQPCVEIVTESGIVLRCSTTAPLPTETDGIVLAPHVAGKRVAVRDGNGTRWEAVARIRGLGLRTVQHISVDNGCFWAGAEPGRCILHHNKLAPNHGANVVNSNAGI